MEDLHKKYIASIGGRISSQRVDRARIASHCREDVMDRAVDHAGEVSGHDGVWRENRVEARFGEHDGNVLAGEDYRRGRRAGINEHIPMLRVRRLDMTKYPARRVCRGGSDMKTTAYGGINVVDGDWKSRGASI